MIFFWTNDSETKLEMITHYRRHRVFTNSTYLLTDVSTAANDSSSLGENKYVQIKRSTQSAGANGT